MKMERERRRKMEKIESLEIELRRAEKGRMSKAGGRSRKTFSSNFFNDDLKTDPS